MCSVYYNHHGAQLHSPPQPQGRPYTITHPALLGHVPLILNLTNPQPGPLYHGATLLAKSSCRLWRLPLDAFVELLRSKPAQEHLLTCALEDMLATLRVGDEADCGIPSGVAPEHYGDGSSADVSTADVAPGEAPPPEGAVAAPRESAKGVSFVVHSAAAPLAATAAHTAPDQELATARQTSGSPTSSGGPRRGNSRRVSASMSQFLLDGPRVTVAAALRLQQKLLSYAAGTAVPASLKPLAYAVRAHLVELESLRWTKDFVHQELLPETKAERLSELSTILRNSRILSVDYDYEGEVPPGVGGLEGPGAAAANLPQGASKPAADGGAQFVGQLRRVLWQSGGTAAGEGGQPEGS